MKLLPGLVVIAVVAVIARFTTQFLPGSISEVTIGIVAGLILAQLITLPNSMRPGVKFAVGPLLKTGIVLLGARLSFLDVLSTGVSALLIVVVCITAALIFTIGVGRMFDLPPRLCLLIGVGTAVCGNSAIVATAPTIEAKEREVSYAVATITLFGTMAVFLYPLLGFLAGFSDEFFGYWAGIAVSDTSQVVATGFAYSDPAGQVATIVKLTRNTLMGPLIVLIGIMYARAGMGQVEEPQAPTGIIRYLNFIPLFVIGFLAMATLNTLGIITDDAASLLNYAAKALILAALVGVGLNTNLREMRTMGLKPLFLGLLAALLLSVLALILIGQFASL